MSMSTVLAMGLPIAPPLVTPDGRGTLKNNPHSPGVTTSLASDASAAVTSSGAATGPTAASCPHIVHCKNDETFRSFRTICAYSLRWRHRHHLQPTPLADDSDDDGDGSARSAAQQKLVNSAALVAEQWRKLPTPLCHGCHASSQRIHACLHCVYLGCRGPHDHLRQHLQTRQHCFAVDFLNLTLYCYECADYKYDMHFDDILLAEKVRLTEALVTIRDPTRPRQSYSMWQPSSQEQALLKTQAMLHTGHMGLRGLRNLGATCFMNAILQTFIHNPLLRAYFLSDRHNRALCRNDRTRCLACQIDSLFAKVYDGDSTPYVPNEFLWSMWMSCSQLVGYAQQDAHEFFIGALNGIHADLENFPIEKSAQSPRKKKTVPCDAVADPHACSCIIHRVFSGLFESRVTCLRCGNQNKVRDPFLDISLDIRPMTAVALASPMRTDSDVRSSSVVISDPIKSIPSAISATIAAAATQPQTLPVNSRQNPVPIPAPVKTKGHDSFLTLYECLDLFTHQERLSAAEYRCGACASHTAPCSTGQEPNRTAGATKQVSLQTLPLVLSLQLKRFDHRHSQYGPGSNLSASSTGAAAGTSYLTATGNNSEASATNGAKLDLIIRFPLDLDMSRYTTGSMHAGGGSINKSGIPDPECQYTLFAVVVHQGTLQSGHYTSYVRQSGGAGQWFKFDDHMVTLAAWSEVAQSQAYMCFYIKKSIEPYHYDH